MNNSLIRSILILSALFLISACSLIYDKHVQWETVKPEIFPVLYATGFAPISMQRSTHETQRMLMAIKASKIAAYAELAEQVYGQQVSGKVTMADLLIEDQQLTASVQGIIRGAKVIKSYPVGDVYTTELQLNFEDVYNIYQANQNRKEIKDVTHF
ncbi:LPP20 family lipoprotein [Colwellia psychrerythraea]|uniref:Putative lipoprotein n=1 Tax=Colwellia psychrerythraea (strain 34H / ATCC BAA-681) TaxID=167879 RepID=Q485Q3_COLP3|nr:LPP20 family lipoprotein [Colwellia psychrerythraea]AAZ25448.1 putative lipoprotein [Colwellia psychrerythraea 34H]